MWLSERAVSVGGTAELWRPAAHFKALPTSLPLDGAVRIELVEGVPIFRASREVQQRIEALVEKSGASEKLTQAEERELDLYEEIDDYLSFVNPTVRNLTQVQPS